ncbi:hypothetical protein V6N13_066772 [Hibiscus sabdariffa]
MSGTNPSLVVFLAGSRQPAFNKPFNQQISTSNRRIKPFLAHVLQEVLQRNCVCPLIRDLTFPDHPHMLHGTSSPHKAQRAMNSCHNSVTPNQSAVNKAPIFRK